MERTSLEGVPVLLDAAHNADSLRWLAEVLMAYRPGERYPLIFGCQASHDPLEMLRVLKPVAGRLVPIEVPVLHPCPLARVIDAAHRLGLAVELPPGFEPNAVPADYAIGNTTELDPPDNRTNWIECVRHGLGLGGRQPVVVCGSIYNMGEILRVFEDGRA